MNRIKRESDSDDGPPPPKRLKLSTPSDTTSTPALAPVPSDPFDYKRLNYKQPNEVKKCLEAFRPRNHAEQVKWPRPQLKRPIDDKTHELVVQIMDIDYISIVNDSEFTRNISASDLSKIPKIRMFGVTAEGHSAMLDIYGFMPYFYAPVPSKLAEWFVPDASDNMVPGDGNQELCACMQRTLNHLILPAIGNKKSLEMNATEYVVSVEVVTRISTEGYWINPTPFFKITTGLPGHVALLRTIMEKGITIFKTTYAFQTYESSTVFASRFMIDSDNMGCSWVSIPAGAYTVVEPHAQTSTSQIEVVTSYESLVAHQPVGEWLKFAPLRVLSFDIECYKVGGEFPLADVDRNMVIDISNILILYDGKGQKSIINNVFALGTSDGVGDVDVRMYLTEEELLQRWRDFVVMADPDIITGHNILGFDLPYLWNRAHHLGLKNFKYMSRVPQTEVRMKDSNFQSKAYGKMTSSEFNMTGRIILDLLPLSQRNFKLRSYSLNSLCKEFLHEQKEDVDHTMIGPLFAESPTTRARLVSYCYKDSLLVLQVLEAKQLILAYLMMAMITGVPFSFLLSRGESVKVHTQLLRIAQKQGFVVPTRIRDPNKKDSDEVGFEGAVVIEPLRGFYEMPIATLDFESLYPSIMIAHNLCYTTWIQPSRIAALTTSMTKGEHYIITPAGHYFVTAKIRLGLLPSVLDGLIAERLKVKDEMAAAKVAGNTELANILNARQLAIKLSANSVYGFTGADRGPLPCVAISESVTAYGRDMINLSRDTAKRHYTIANGYKWDCEVIYGDTDSIMVKFGTESLEEAMAMGNEAAKIITKLFPPPIRLAFEKCYWPYLLSSKKRYAGLFWLNTTKPLKLDVKGMESVRRDNCLMVKKMVDQCLKYIIIDRRPGDAIAYCKQLVTDLIQNKVDMSQLVISKAFSRAEKDYKGIQPHIELNKKLAARGGKQQPYVVGDRIQYVVLQGDSKTPMSLRTEDPIYALENRLQIDPQFYIGMLRKPVKRLLQAFIKNPATGKVVARGHVPQATVSMPKVAVRKLPEEFPPVKNELKNLDEIFVGDHTRIVVKVTPLPQKGLITSFTKVIRCCIQCKATLKVDEGNPCQTCVNYSSPIVKYMEVLGTLRTHENEYGRIMTHCQTCQGSRFNEVICGARDCEIFYKRISSKMDLERVRERMGQLTLDDDERREVRIHAARKQGQASAAATTRDDGDVPMLDELPDIDKDTYDW